eukprot:gene41294-54723_t
MNALHEVPLQVEDFPLQRRSLRISVVTETYPPEVNGVARTIACVVEGLRQRQHEVQLIRPSQGKESSAPSEAADTRFHEVLMRGLPIPRYPHLRMGMTSRRALVSLWSRRRPDLVHIATEGPMGWTALQAAVQMKLPVCSDFRTNFHHYSRHYGLGACEGLVLSGLRHFHNRTQCTFVPTRAALRELFQHRFDNLCVVGRGVDIQRFHPRHRCDALRRQWQAGVGDAVLLCVSRLAAEKNVGLALRCFESLRSRCPGARMVVVGDGPMRRKLEAAHPQVHFAGMLRGDALAQAYASADLFVFPSLSETFGNVTLEALASGLPVVAFRAAAAAEHVLHR